MHADKPVRTMEWGVIVLKSLSNASFKAGGGGREAKGLAQEYTIVSRELEYSPSLPIFIYFIVFLIAKDHMFAAVILTTQK